MNPFDAPPSTPAVSYEPPVDPPAPRRGRTVAIVLGTAGVIGAGIVGVSALASADDPELSDVATVTDDGSSNQESVDDEPSDDGEPADDPADEVDDGEIRIQIGDGEPIVLDLGAIGDLGDGSWGELHECLDLPMLDMTAPEILDGTGELDLGELGPLFDEFLGELPMFSDGVFDDEDLRAWLDELETIEWPTGDGVDGEPGGAWLEGIDLGDQVTVLGDDGLTVIDLGDGDATVTIERDGETGELTITTDGTATEQEIGQWFEDIELPALPDGEWALPEGELFDRLEECGIGLDP